MPKSSAAPAPAAKKRSAPQVNETAFAAAAQKKVKQEKTAFAAAGQKKVKQENTAALAPQPTSPSLRMYSVRTALREMPEPHAAVREMLIQMLPMSLGRPVGERNADQQAVAAMIGEALGDHRLALQGAVATEEEKAIRTAALQAASEEKHGYLKSQLEESRKVVGALKSALGVEARKVAAAKAACDGATDAEKESHKKVEALDADLIDLKRVQAEDFVVLRDGAWETGGAKSHLDALQVIMSKGGDCFDSTLKSALPGACTKAPANRGDFENIVIQNLELSLAKRLPELKAELENAKLATPEFTAKRVAAGVQLESAQAEWQVAADAVATAEATEADLVTSLRAIEKEVATHKQSLKTIRETLACRTSRLEAFEGGPLKGYVSLTEEVAKKQPEGIKPFAAVGGA